MSNVRLVGDNLYGKNDGCRLWCLWGVFLCSPFSMGCLGSDLGLNWVSLRGFSYLLFYSSADNASSFLSNLEQVLYIYSSQEIPQKLP